VYVTLVNRLLDAQMNDIQARLTNSFSIVFPDIQPEEIRKASTASLAAWDSVAHITLLSAVSEEFGVEMSADDFEELVSFELIADYLASRTANA
jgi:acyl carrier protein